ncbi:CBS-domain-containing membrane protein [Streptomyces sp. SceaMP-e96]|uniref:CBS domain-containing protein n=1 Tax=Streptomyces TaxID=1883 RepID=UPI000823E239|nr:MULTISPECIES: CBS domain-containing protein [unclassified Streptomyces]SCK34751.1 CBS-domain-containing membrane protein [Streptomyces sp. SceaMP-e96]
MTDDVVSARSGTPADDVARWLAEYDINGLPVVDAEDRVIGVVSATDLKRVRRAPAAEGMLTAGAVMSAPARTVRADDSVVRAARLMSTSGVERLPVVDEEARLVGMITRRDVLQIFARPDADIRNEVADEIVVRALWLSPQSVDVAVHDGVVTLSGHVESSGSVALTVWMTRQVDGVTAVINRLTYQHEDPHRQQA